MSTKPKQIRIDVPARYQCLYEPRCRYRSVLYHGGRSGGKSTEVARALLFRAALYPGTRIACLREFHTSLKNTVKQLLEDEIGILGLAGFKSTKEDISHRNGSFFTFHGMHRNLDNLKGLANYHVSWVEEGQSVSNESLEWLTPTIIRKKDAFMVTTMNRYSERDPAWVRLQPETMIDAAVFRVLYTENKHLPEDVIRLAELCKNTNPEEYRHVWLGEPVTQSSECILSAGSISQAMHGNRPYDSGPVQWGLDVARMGDDASILTRAEGNRATVQYERRKSPLDQTVDWVMGKVTRGERIKVDDTGLGGGVTDYLKRNGYNVVPVNFGAKAKDRDHYDLVIDEMWGQFAEMQDSVILPDDPQLFEELTFRRYGIDKYGRKRVQSKEDFRKIIHRSPDRADSLLLAFYNPPVTSYNVWVL